MTLVGGIELHFECNPTIHIQTYNSNLMTVLNFQIRAFILSPHFAGKWISITINNIIQSVAFRIVHTLLSDFCTRSPRVVCFCNLITT